MCAVIMDTIDRSAQRETFDLRDMYAEGSLPFERQAVEREIHVTDETGTTYRGADAILKILDQYPHWRALSAVARFPLFKPLLPIGYNFVASNRHFLFGSAARIYWLKVAVAVGFAASIFLSLRLWLSARLYPFTPVFPGLPPIPHPLDYMLVSSLFVLLGAIVVSSKPRPFIWSFCGIIIVLCLFDQSRWQPWVFQYLFLLFALGLFSWKSTAIKEQTNTLNAARLIVASTYLYSGLQKANLGFMRSVFPWLVTPITTLWPFAASFLYPLGYIAPFIQIGFAIGLLTKRFRKVSLALAISMHIFILAMLGPFGLNWNNVVWPWTAAIAVFDITLFAGTSEFTFDDIFRTLPTPFDALIIVLFIVMPALSFFNLWDSYLSAALYSQNTNVGVVYMDDRVMSELPASVQQYVRPVGPNTNALSIDDWSTGELNVPAYPEDRIYESIAEAMCTWTHDPADLTLVIQDERMFNDGPIREITCGELQSETLRL